MMYYIESPSTDPGFNLALEQYVFDSLPREHAYFMLWRNDNAVIVGKHQNTLAEVNSRYAEEHGVRVVRRLSGGGAVYHDLGNINFTFIADYSGNQFDFSTFCRPVMAALESFGVKAELNGRNDMTIQGRKFSGNSQYIKHDRVMHHGTIMYDSDLDAVRQALQVSGDKLSSKGITSVRSRVTNVSAHMPQPISTERFMERLRAYMFVEYHLCEYALTEQDICGAERLREEIYDRWEWNYGCSPACQIVKLRRAERCGEIEIHMDVQDGIIRALHFYGDFFSMKDPALLAEHLLGVRLEESALYKALEGWAVGDYFQNLDLRTFCAMLLR